MRKRNKKRAVIAELIRIVADKSLPTELRIQAARTLFPSP